MLASILLEQKGNGFIADIFGYLVKLIHNTFGIENIIVTIIIFTIVVYMLLLPLTYKQQKFSKLSMKINPEMQAIQKKYQGKNDNESRMRLNTETQALYDKYGISPIGSCLPTLIQFPIIIGMFNVIRNIENYITGSTNFLGMDIRKTPLEEIGGEGLGGIISSLFKGIASFDVVVILAFLIPIISGLTQWLSIKISMSGQSKTNDNNPAMASMKMMNNTMPIISTIMVFSFPIGLGLYWTFGAVVRTIQMKLLNMHFDRMDFEKIVEKNREKAAKKQAKREGYMQAAISQNGKMNTRNMSSDNNEELLEKANQARSNAKPGSMASKANLVRDYNNKNTSK